MTLQHCQEKIGLNSKFLQNDDPTGKTNGALLSQWFAHHKKKGDKSVQKKKLKVTMGWLCTQVFNYTRDKWNLKKRK